MRVTVRGYNPLLQIDLGYVVCPRCAMQDCKGVARIARTRRVAPRPGREHSTRNSLTPVLFCTSRYHEVLNYRHYSTLAVSPRPASFCLVLPSCVAKW